MPDPFFAHRNYKEVTVDDVVIGYIDRTFPPEILVKLPCGYTQRFRVPGTDQEKIIIAQQMKDCLIKGIQ